MNLPPDALAWVEKGVPCSKGLGSRLTLGWLLEALVPERLDALGDAAPTVLAMALKAHGDAVRVEAVRILGDDVVVDQSEAPDVQLLAQ